MSGGSLLRLFQSECFDAHLHMHYLHRMEQSGVQDYLVNELYKMTDTDVDFYLPQLCQIALLRFNDSSLYRFLLDKAADSMHFALKIYWLVKSVAEDKMPELSEAAVTMLNMCEAAMVNSGGNGSSTSLERSERQATPVQRSSSDPQLSRMASPTNASSLSLAASLAQVAGESPRMDLIRREVSISSNSRRPCRGDLLKHVVEVSRSSTAEQKAGALGCDPSLPNAFVELGDPSGSAVLGSEDDSLENEMRQFMMKRRRCDYFNTQNQLLSMFVKLSTALVGIAERPERTTALRNALGVLNRWLFERRVFMCLGSEDQLRLLGLHVPILKKRDSRHQILRLSVAQCRVFSSATRAPYLLVYETADLEEDADGCANTIGSPASPMEGDNESPLEVLARCVAQELAEAEALVNGTDASTSDGAPASVAGMPDGQLDDQPCAGDVARSTSGVVADAKASALEALREQFTGLSAESWKNSALGQAPAPSPVRPIMPNPCSRCPYAAEWPDVQQQDVEDIAAKLPARCAKCPARLRSETARKTRLQIWGESWEERRERARKASPFGHYRSWGMDAVFVKGGDDLRQELLAAQIINTFSRIFKDAGLPLWLKEMEVLVTSSSSGLIECIHDSVSIDSLKKHYPGKSLGEIFKVAFADKLFEAKKNFIESSAAYSLVVWFLQVKDRHNANLMLDSSGRVTHIDFGFMLSNSPGGNMAFEQSPFKLTQEFLDVMDGECSDQYEYFRTLLIRGFLESRKHMEKILLLVRMMLTGSKMPCFREGADWVLSTLQERFYMSLTEEACIEKVVDLIDTSVNNWRTIQYDNYQRIVHGIL